MPEHDTTSREHWIELRTGVPWASPQQLNRIARQQGLCLAIAQAAVYDEICQAVSLPESDVDALTQALPCRTGHPPPGGSEALSAGQGLEQRRPHLFRHQGISGQPLSGACLR